MSFLLATSALAGLGVGSEGPRADVAYEIRCGVAPGLPAFSRTTGSPGYDVALCQALAVALIGKGGRAGIVPVETIDSLVRDRRVDIVFHQLTIKPEREAAWDVRFSAMIYDDGQSFLVDARSSILSMRELANKRICVLARTPARRQIEADPAMRTASWVETSVPGEALAALGAGKCDAWSADESLIAAALSDGGAVSAYRLLPERISVEPIGAIVREDDRRMLRAMNEVITMLSGASRCDDAANMTEANCRRIVEKFGSLCTMFAVGLGPGFPLRRSGPVTPLEQGAPRVPSLDGRSCGTPHTARRLPSPAA